MKQAIVMPNEILLVSFDFTHGPENRLCIVGKKDGEGLTIVNAFQGDAAEELFRKLTIVATNHKSEG